MKRLLKSAIKRLAKPLVRGAKQESTEVLVDNEVAAQKLLMGQHRLLASQAGATLPGLRDVGFRKYSQFEEDGILLYIFSLIPPINRKCVEICAGDGKECNTANLIINHGWWGYLFDGDEENIQTARRFFGRNKDTFIYPPRLQRVWITAENVNAVIEEAGVRGPIDLLSLDIDGMDYWIWKAISVVEPQVVVCETHNPIPPDKALTVPYDPDFVSVSENYRGASLAAMCKLGREKGYRLIGTHRFGFNAFFIKNGVGERYFPEVNPASCVVDPFSELARKERWPKAREFNWQEV